MKNTRIMRVFCSLAAALMLAVSVPAALPVLAATGTVHDTVNVRSKATASSDLVVTLSNGDTVDVGDTVTNDSGETWYAVTTSGGQTGYIRNDLLTVTEDESDSEGGEGGTEATSTMGYAQAQGDGYAEAISPVSAVVTSDVNIRSGAGTDYNKSGELTAGTELVLIGAASDTDGHVWYQFYTTGTSQQMIGFIRDDYVSLGDSIETASSGSSDSSSDSGETPDYQAVYTQDENGNDTWYLYNNAAGTRKKIADIDTAIDTAQSNAETSEAQAEQYRLYMLIVAAVLAVAFIIIIALIIKLVRTSNESGEVDLMNIRKRQEKQKKDAPAQDVSRVRTPASSGRSVEPDRARAASRQGTRSPYPSGRAQSVSSDDRADRSSDRSERMDRRQPVQRNSRSEDDSDVQVRSPRRTERSDAARSSYSQNPDARKENRTADSADSSRSYRTERSSDAVRRDVRSDVRNDVRSDAPARKSSSQYASPSQQNPAPYASRENARPVQNFAGVDSDDYQFIDVDNGDY